MPPPTWSDRSLPRGSGLRDIPAEIRGAGPVAALIAIAVAAVLTYLTRDVMFYQDVWTFIITRSGPRR